jgi:hypothetical protein
MLREAILQFLFQLRLEGYSPGTQRGFRRRLEAFFLFFGDIELTAIEKRAVILYIIDELKRYRRRSAVRIFVRWLAAQGYLPEDLSRLRPAIAAGPDFMPRLRSGLDIFGEQHKQLLRF